MKTQEIKEYNRKKIICAIHKIEDYEEASVKELGVGCKIKVKNDFGERMLIIGQYCDLFLTYIKPPEFSEYFEITEIIGKPLTLDKVLLSLEPYPNNYGFIAGNIARIDRKKQTYNFICRWDLSKETLEEQSEETQRAIYELLTEK
jgi:hypothetical protein